jgi:hypothetical protein
MTELLSEVLVCDARLPAPLPLESVGGGAARFPKNPVEQPSVRAVDDRVSRDAISGRSG